MRGWGSRALGWILLSLAAGGCRCGAQLQAVTGHVGVSPSALDFGAVPAGQTATAPLVVQNLGDVELSLSGAAFSGPNASDFSLQTSIDGAVLKAGQSATVIVAFAPGDAGPRQAVLEITTQAPDTAALDIPLSGTGIDVQICPQPDPVSFGDVQVGGTPVSVPLSLLNCGQSPAQVTLQPVAGAQASDFAIIGATTALLSPGQSLSVSVVFQPAALGAASANIPWLACDACAPSPSIALSGMGVDAALSLSPSPAAFGVVDIGQSATVPVVAANTGTAPLTITAAGVRGAASPFQWASPLALPISLAPGQTATLSLVFSPAIGGPAQDTLDVTYAVADPVIAPRLLSDGLIANGWPMPCAIRATPTAVQFGTVQPGAIPPAARTVTISNSGEAACSLGGIGIGAGSDASFAMAGPTSVAVPGGGSVSISITFSPAVGLPPTRTGTLVFTSDDPAHPNNAIPLSGMVAASPYSGGWPKWHSDNANTGRSPADTSQLTGTVAWKFPVGKITSTAEAYLQSPVVDMQGNIYFESMSGMLYALSPAGTLLWSTQLSDPSADPHPSTPVVLADGSLYVASGQEQADPSRPNLYHLSSAGQVLYSRNWGIEGFSATPGFGADGTLFEADDDGIPGNGPDPSDLIAFHVQSDGAVVPIAQYRAPFPLPASGTVIERLGVVIAADDTSYWCAGTHCFGMSPPTTFAPLTAWPSQGVTIATPPGNLIDNGSGEVVADLAMDTASGTLYAYAAWETSVNVNLAVQGVLVAVNASSGAIKWTLPLPLTELPLNALQNLADFGNAAPAVATDGTVYVGNGDGVRAVNGSTGAVKWLFRTANVTDAPAIGGDGTLFFGTRDGTFYAVRPDGTPRFQLTTSGQVASAPAIANDGTVYFVSDDGNLYAVH
jgi:outer membrane protein assembly factor BamB